MHASTTMHEKGAEANRAATSTKKITRKAAGRMVMETIAANMYRVSEQ